MKCMKMDSSILMLLMLLLTSFINCEYIEISAEQVTEKQINETTDSYEIEEQKFFTENDENNSSTESSTESRSNSFARSSPVLFLDPLDHNRGSRESPRIVTASTGAPRDSYLDAYAMSHGAQNIPNVDSEHFVSSPSYQVPQYTAPPKNTYLPSTSSDRSAYYRAPHQPGYFSKFEHQTTLYGPPSSPAPFYGSPSSPAPHYGPPMYHDQDYEMYDHHESYGVPYQAPGIFEKFKLSLNWYFLAKLLLKLILFKKFIKFAAILCLLFLIPKFKKLHHKGDHKDDDRSLTLTNEDTNMELMNILTRAIDVYSSLNNDDSKNEV